MAQFFIERDLFSNPTADWKSNKGPTINDPPSDFFEAAVTGEPATMMVTNGSTAAWGGALVSRKRGVPAYNGKKLNWLAYRFEFRFDPKTGANVARHETDLKVCVRTRPSSAVKIRNVANFSVQWNPNANGGRGGYQIDLDPPGWVECGFIVEDIAPDVWHTQEFRFWFDETNQVFSVLSIQLDEQIYMIPSNLQNVPMQMTNWEEISSEQMQNEVYAAKSTTLVEYRNGVLCWSDERITMIPAPPAREREATFWLPRLDDGSQVLIGGDFDPFGPDAEAEPRRIIDDVRGNREQGTGNRDE